jgi:hypothetical protein
MACHFDDIRSATFFFERVFRSIANQTRRSDKFLLSWSSASNVRDFCHRLFGNLQIEFGEWLVNLHSEIQRFQFQHYKRINIELQRLIENDNNQWYLIFGDSDDIWQNIRVEYMVNQAGALLGVTPIFVFNWNKAADGVVNVATNQSNFEYWMCMMKSDVLNDFYENLIDEGYLQNYWTDLAFDTYMLATFGDSIHHFSTECQFLDPNDPWLYWNTREGSLRNRVFVDEVDYIVQYMKRRLMECYPNSLNNNNFRDETLSFDVIIHRTIILQDILAIENSEANLQDFVTVIGRRCVIS